jgi:magnesium transporter
VGMVVNCSAYADGRRAGDVRLEEVSDALAADRPGAFVWIGLFEPSEELMGEVQREFGLHELAVEDAHRAHQRPKVEEYGDGAFVVLRTARADGEGQRIAWGETHVFVGPRYVVSVRHGASLSYAEVRARCERSPELLRKGPGYVLYALMDFVVDQFFPVLDALEDELERLEEAIFGGAFGRDTTERIYDLRRDLIALKRAVSPLVEVCNHLLRLGGALVPEDIRPYFRDVYDHAIRINEWVDLLRELLNGALEANLALMAVRQNEVMKKLAGWAAIIAMPTMIAGIYGMNFAHMPELGWRFGYPLVLGVMATLCTLLHRGFRRAGWL